MLQICAEKHPNETTHHQTLAVLLLTIWHWNFYFNYWCTWDTKSNCQYLYMSARKIVLIKLCLIQVR